MRSFPLQRSSVQIGMLALLAWFLQTPHAFSQVDARFYETKVKPLLHDKCSSCHGPLRKEAGLRLDTAAFLLQGSEAGAIVDLESPSQSKILARLSSQSSDRMPPEGEGVPLTPEDIATIQTWIAHRSPAPESEVAIAGPSDHWAFQPIRRPAVNKGTVSEESPIDTLLAEAQKTRGIEPLKEADPPSLLRRLTFDLAGIPPTPQELEAFMADPSPEAYQKKIDALLSRPTYGERWGRHWMDIWRYSDWDGYKDELRGSQRNIWHWRDWIVESLNENKPYDQMIVEMLAGDEIAPLDPKVLRATGFLARNYHTSNRNIWLDATVEHTAKAFVGLTINCAKCHDHKYDPLPQSDYYRFRAIFEPHKIRTDPLRQAASAKLEFPRAYDADLAAPTYLFVRGDDKQPLKDKPIESAVPSFLKFSEEFGMHPVSLPTASYLPELTPEAEKDAIEKAWKKCDEVQGSLAKALAQQKDLDLKEVSESPKEAPDVSLELVKLREAEASLRSIKKRFAAEKAKHLQEDSNLKTSLASEALIAEQNWKDIEIELRIATAKRGLQTAEASPQKDEKKKTAAIEKAKKDLMAVEEMQKKMNAADQSGKLKEYTPIAKGYPKESTGRRTALARWIVNPQNPLTARVAVNHLWSRHFGAPLVESVFDFGMKTPKPELIAVLDWLAAELIESGWDMKHMHRVLLCTKAYRRASSLAVTTEVPSSTSEIARFELARKKDPDNLTFWRSHVRRLDAEEVRDSLLSVSQLLDPSMGGPDIDEEQGEKIFRRSLYFRHAYEKQMTMMVMFDAASPNECYRRKPSVIPQQALVLANSQLARTASRKIASRIWQECDQKEPQFIDRLFREILSRPPDAKELQACQNFMKERGQVAAKDPMEQACQSLAHVLLNHNDFVSLR